MLTLIEYLVLRLRVLQLHTSSYTYTQTQRCIFTHILTVTATVKHRANDCESLSAQAVSFHREHSHRSILRRPKAIRTRAVVRKPSVHSNVRFGLSSLYRFVGALASTEKAKPFPSYHVDAKSTSPSATRLKCSTRSTEL
jgi:hypothetical protein